MQFYIISILNMASATVVKVMEDNLSVGIIGCGEITSKFTAYALEKAGNVKVGMVMDVTEWAAKDLGKKCGVPYTTNMEDLVSNRHIDFVYIATPHYLHAPITIKAAKAGKHVVVEKPIAVNLEQADLMISECQKNRVKLSVCFPIRYTPNIKKAKELVSKGVLGRIIGTRITGLGVKPDSYWEGGYSGRIKSNWRTLKDKSGGGVLIMNSTHSIDYMRHITGLEAERVYSEYDTFLTPVDVEDFITVVIRYANGAIGIIEASSCIPGGPRPANVHGDRIYGSEGHLIIPSIWGKPTLWIYTRRDSEFGEANKWHRIEIEGQGRTIYVSSAKQFFEDFAEAILLAKEPPITGQDGRKALEVVIAAYESCLKKRVIHLA